MKTLLEAMHNLKESKSTDFNKFNDIIREYLPKSGEGNTLATQFVTALNLLVYRYFNDRDLPLGKEGEEPLLVDHVFSWLRFNIPEFKDFEMYNNEEWKILSNLLDSYEIDEYYKKLGGFYINHLYEFMDKYLNKDYLNNLNKQNSKYSIYDY